MPEVSYPMWHGLYVVKGTPKATIDALNAALRKAVADPRGGEAEAARNPAVPRQTR